MYFFDSLLEKSDSRKRGEYMVLSGIKVLDLARFLPGPFCTMFLADFGAGVIKLSSRGGGIMRAGHLLCGKGWACAI